MSCQAFETLLSSGEMNAAGLAHMRSCAACLSVAISADPDYLFKSLGGAELIPAGGIDEFVTEVVQQVNVRRTEQAIGPSSLRVAPVYRWAIAATLSFAAISGLLEPARISSPGSSSLVAVTKGVTGPREPLTARPVVESYQASAATIVELPTDASSDTQIVMVFDETLPKDL